MGLTIAAHIRDFFVAIGPIVLPGIQEGALSVFFVIRHKNKTATPRRPELDNLRWPFLWS